MMNAEGKAVVYQIQVETKKSSDELIFEEVWIDEKRFKIKLRDQEGRSYRLFQDKQVVNLDIAEEAVQDETSFVRKEILKKQSPRRIQYREQKRNFSRSVNLMKTTRTNFQEE